MDDKEKKKYETRFLKDVKEHGMEIIRDDGINRHIRFKRKDESAYYFDIVTWPGTLAISGDCGTWVFSRTVDMFEFFRTKKQDWNYNKKGGLSINPSYWSEKLLAVDASRGKRDGGPQEYSSDIFEKRIRERIKEYFSGDGRQSSKMRKVKKDLIEQVEEQVLCAETEERAHSYASDFSYDYINDDGNKRTFRLEDFWETNLRDWTWGFIWNLHAIVWGIREYDKFQENKVIPLTSNGQ